MPLKVTHRDRETFYQWQMFGKQPISRITLYYGSSDFVLVALICALVTLVLSW